MSAPPAVIFREIEALLAHGFTGQITLNCAEGKIVRYEKREIFIPGQPKGVAQPPPNH